MAGDERPERVRVSYGKNYERLAALKQPAGRDILRDVNFVICSRPAEVVLFD